MDVTQLLYSFSLLTLLLLQFGSSNKVKTLHTAGYYYSQYFPLEENLTPDRLLRFSVRAPRDAHVLLAPTHNADEPVYEIVLGAHDNTINYIRGRCPCQEEPSATVPTVNLLDSREFRNFWVRIHTERQKTFVQVGLGNNDKPFHEWRDPRPLNPHYLSFRSSTKAEWRYGFNDSSYKSGVSPDKRQVIVTSTGFSQYFELSNVVSHSIDGVTLYFTARTRKELQILLSSEASTLGDVYLIGIHENGAYLRKRLLGENKADYQQAGFLNEKERLRFWIKLTIDGIITLGKGGSLSPLFDWRDPNPLSPQYLSFAMYRDDKEEYNPAIFADVEYGLGSDYTLSSQDCKPRWKESIGKLPPGAVRSGWLNGYDIFVCRAKHEGEIVPGSYVADPEKEGCYISFNHNALEKPGSEVLTGCNMDWVPASMGHTPEHSVVGSFQKGKAKYYVTRVKYEGVLITGKLKQNDRIAYFPYAGEELPFINYEILVQKTTDKPASIIIGTKSPSSLFLATSRD